MEETMGLTPEETLSLLSDKIIENIIHADEESMKKRQYLFGVLQPIVFSDENHIIYKVFHKFKEQRITPDAEFLKLLLARNHGIIEESKSRLNIAEYSDIDENPILGYIGGVIKQYNRLIQSEQISFDEFKLAIEKYKIEYKNIEANRIYSQARIIVNEGLTIGRTKLFGYEDSEAFVKKKFAELDGLMDTTEGEGFINSREEALNESNKSKAPRKIGDFGDIKELNEHYGGIYTPMMYSVMAPTKGGKSKFCTMCAHNVIISGNNIAVWAHEGGYQAWWAQMRAHHFDWLYNRNETDPAKIKRGITQEVILNNTYKSEELRSLEQASALDLFTNPSYGVIYMIDRPFLTETVVDELETAVQLSNASLIVIDYLQLIGSKIIKAKHERIGEAYQRILAWQKKRNVAVMSPAQFTQDFMKEVASSKDSGSLETRTAGGESSEIIRTPDINIALYASPEDLMHNSMKLLSVPSRFSKPFAPFEINIDLGVSRFSSIV